MKSSNLKIIIADDHPLLLEGNTAFLKRRGFDIIASCGNGQSALNNILEKKPDLAILDMDMPVLNGLEVSQATKRAGISCKILLLTMHKRQNLRNEVGKTIEGYLIKDDAVIELETAINHLMQGKVYVSPKIKQSIYDTKDSQIDLLTPTELKICKTLAKNISSREAAQELFISQRTVEKHRSNIIRKLKLGREQNALITWLQNHPEILNL